jgi:ribosomal protein S18 acetylase RimI-like enzyme
VTGVGDPADGTPQHPDGPGAHPAPGPSAASGGPGGGRAGSVDGGGPADRVASADRPGSAASGVALPARWADDPFLLDERAGWRPAEVHADGDAMLLVQRAVGAPREPGHAPGATMLLAVGPAEPVAALLRAHARSGHRFAWVDTGAFGLLRADEVAALGLAPNRTGWEWLVTETAPAPVAAEARVRELDPRADAAAIRACLHDANPTSDADPDGAGERWWGAVDGAGRLGGVIGAGPRAGRPGGRGSAHLHGLGVRPGERGQGLGAALTAGAVRALLADGADWVSLGMWDDNHGARRIYHRLGLRTVHRLTTLRARPA